jgi:alkylresorcinol/alkylpyrone synthase
MSRISAVGTAVPPYRVDQDSVRDFSRSLFQEAFPDIDRLIPIFDNALIRERYFSAPPDWFSRQHTFAEKNDVYVAMAIELGKTAILKCLSTAGLEPQAIDHIIFVSTTGLATPSIDARLVNALALRKDIRRTPVWGLGCAGGVSGLTRAFEFTRAFPDKRALVLALELCSLTFLRNDLSKSNLVATSLFGDGAAAVLVSGAETGDEGPVILGSRSTIWYDSLDVMGWEVNQQGLKVLFSRDIPTIVSEWVLPSLLEFVGENGITLKDLTHLIAHPGGTKVLEAYKQTLGLNDGQLDRARDVLTRFGNMSSPTVLFVLKEFMEAQAVRPGEYGLVTALGPGFSSEMLLIQG